MKFDGGGGFMLCKFFSSAEPQRLVMEDERFSQTQGNPEGAKAKINGNRLKTNIKIKN